MADELDDLDFGDDQHDGAIVSETPATAEPAAASAAASSSPSAIPHAIPGEFALYVSGIDGDEDIWRGKLSAYAEVDEDLLSFGNWGPENAKITFPDQESLSRAQMELGQKSELTINL